MARKKRWRNTVLTLVVLVPVVAVVVYSSFQVSGFECTVCVPYAGREVCRTVMAKTEEEGLQSATNNACALLASGVTESMRCQRTEPTSAECRRLVEEPSARPTLGEF